MNTTTFAITDADGLSVEWVQIAHDDGSFTSMLKEIYDAQQAAQATLVTESAPTA